MCAPSSTRPPVVWLRHKRQRDLGQQHAVVARRRCRRTTRVRTRPLSTAGVSLRSTPETPHRSTRPPWMLAPARPQAASSARRRADWKARLPRARASRNSSSVSASRSERAISTLRSHAMNARSASSSIWSGGRYRSSSRNPSAIRVYATEARRFGRARRALAHCRSRTAVPEHENTVSRSSGGESTPGRR